MDISLSGNPFAESNDDMSLRYCPLHEPHSLDDDHLPSPPDLRGTLVLLGYPETEYESSAQHVKSHFPGIPLDHKVAVRMYTSNLLHMHLNSSLRSNDHTKWRPFVDCLRRGIQSL
eukprot:PhF_6_TR10755/c0_g1_i1/m.17289